MYIRGHHISADDRRGEGSEPKYHHGVRGGLSVGWQTRNMMVKAWYACFRPVIPLFRWANLASADIWMTPNEDSQYENHFYVLNVHVIGISYKRFSRFLRYFLHLRLFAFSWFGSSIEEASGTLSVALKAVALVTPISSPQHPKMCLLLQPAKKKHLL